MKLLIDDFVLGRGHESIGISILVLIFGQLSKVVWNWGIIIFMVVILNLNLSCYLHLKINKYLTSMVY